MLLKLYTQYVPVAGALPDWSNATPRISGAIPMMMSQTHSDLPQAVMPTCPPQLLLRGQTALMTGASSGIGKQIAIALGLAGADVVVNYATNLHKAEEAVTAIRKQCGVHAYAHQADVANEEEVQP